MYVYIIEIVTFNNNEGLKTTTLRMIQFTHLDIRYIAIIELQQDSMSNITVTHDCQQTVASIHNIDYLIRRVVDNITESLDHYQ